MNADRRLLCSLFDCLQHVLDAMGQVLVNAVHILLKNECGADRTLLLESKLYLIVRAFRFILRIRATAGPALSFRTTHQLFAQQFSDESKAPAQLSGVLQSIIVVCCRPCQTTASLA